MDEHALAFGRSQQGQSFYWLARGAGSDFVCPLECRKLSTLVAQIRAEAGGRGLD